MEISYAKEILGMLADGINPFTGEVLPASDSCNQPDVIRALNAAVVQLEKARKAEKREKSLPENAGKPWPQKDDEKLVQMFEEGCSKKELCDFFKRTEGSLSSRLVRLGIIQNREEFRHRK